MFKKSCLALSLIIMPLTAEGSEAESGLVLKQHIEDGIKAFQDLPASESNEDSIKILEQLGMLNDARFHFFEAQKKMMEDLAGELKKLAEKIATINKVEAAISGQPSNNAENTDSGDTADVNDSDSPLIQHIQAIEKHLRALPPSDDINALVEALGQIVDLEHERHSFSGHFKQALEKLIQVLGKLPEHMAKVESIKQAIGGGSQTENQDQENDDEEGLKKYGKRKKK